MKRIAALLLAGVAAVALAGEMPKALSLGSSIPSADVKMKNIDGRELSLNDLKGPKGTLVIFSCNHCPYVKAWEDRIAASGNRAMGIGFGVVSINSNDPSQHSEDAFDAMTVRAREKGFKFPYVVDATSGVARAFGATRTPEVFLFDGSNRLIYHGAIDDNAENAGAVKDHYLDSAIDAVAAGKAVDVKETKAIGCGIKFRS